MEIWQSAIIIIFGIISSFGFLQGLSQCRRNNPWGLTPIYNIIGAFVWVDAAIFGAFWTLVSIICLFLGDTLLFFTIMSVFWLVRSVGETIYWLNEQFAATKRNKPETLWHSKIFPGSSSYVASQIFWQCITVITLLSSIYLVKMWLS